MGMPQNAMDMWEAEPEVETLRTAYANLTEAMSRSELLLAAEDRGWLRISSDPLSGEYNREGLRLITDRARMYARKDPLIKRGVEVQQFYVYARGVTFAAADHRVQAVVDDFVMDKKNQSVLTGHQAKLQLERELMISANLFFALFVSEASGKVRVRTIPFEEIEDIQLNPEDRSEPWYYIRRRTVMTGKATYHDEWTAHPDWRNKLTGTTSVEHEGKAIPVKWDVPVYHVKVGSDATEKFGLSQVYAALDWAKAYKEFLTDWAVLVKSLSRFAWRTTVKGGQAAVAQEAAIRGRIPEDPLQAQTNRRGAGATLVENQNVNTEPIPKTGASTSAEDGRRLLLMVCAALGLPETFFGDVSVGTLATATSLDRPTELKFTERQEFWADIWNDILQYVVDMAILAGTLDGTFVKDDHGPESDDGEFMLAAPVGLEESHRDGDWGDRTIEVRFPSILEHDTAGAVTAVVDAVTLKGRTLNETIITPQQASRMLLEAYGVDDVESWLKEIFPVDEQGNEVLRPDQQRREEQREKAATAALALANKQPQPPETPQDAAGQLGEALRAFTEAVNEVRLWSESMRAA